jgi:hypothetical protein
VYFSTYRQRARRIPVRAYLLNRGAETSLGLATLGRDRRFQCMAGRSADRTEFDRSERTSKTSREPNEKQIEALPARLSIEPIQCLLSASIRSSVTPAIGRTDGKARPPAADAVPKHPKAVERQPPEPDKTSQGGRAVANGTTACFRANYCEKHPLSSHLRDKLCALSKNDANTIFSKRKEDILHRFRFRRAAARSQG